MYFLSVIDAIGKSQFNIEKMVFVDMLGVSSKTAKKYLNLSTSIKSRQFTQIKNTFKYASQHTDDFIKVKLSEYMLNAMEAAETESEYTMLGIKDGYELAIEDTCKKEGISPTDLDYKLNLFHYSMCFIDEASLPRRKITCEPIDWPSILGAFPYNVIPESELNYCKELDGRTDFNCFSDSRFNEVFKESFLGVMAAVYLDLEHYCLLFNKDTASFRDFFRQTWSKKNASAFFFEFLRNNSVFSTHEEFYKDMNKKFPKLDLESVKTNYKRWCRTGSLKDEQWLKLAGGEIGEEYAFLRLWFVAANLLEDVKQFGALAKQDYSIDDFEKDLTRWCEIIKKELPFVSWQPFKAAS